MVTPFLAADGWSITVGALSGERVARPCVQARVRPLRPRPKKIRMPPLSLLSLNHSLPPSLRPPHPLPSQPTACLKDLQRFLRRDDPATRPAFTLLSRFNLAKSDLVPLLTRYADDEEVVVQARAFFVFHFFHSFSLSFFALFFFLF